MPAEQPFVFETYKRRFNEVKNASFLADRVDGLAKLAADIGEKLTQFEKDRAKESFLGGRIGSAAGIALGLLAGVMLAPTAPVTPLFAMGGMMFGIIPAGLAGDWIAKRSFDKKHGPDIAILKNLKENAVWERSTQISLMERMPAEELAGLARYDDLIQEPAIAQTLARKFKESVAAPVYEQGKAGKPGPHGSGRHHYGRVPTAS